MTRVLVFGSSVDHGFWGEEGGWVQRLRRDLDRYSMEDEKDYSLYNLSISGDTTERILERMENEIEARENHEDLHIYLEIGGINDSQIELETEENWIPLEKYQKNIKKIVEIAREKAQEVVLFTGRPVDKSKVYPMPWKETHGYTNPEAERYTRILREVAQEEEELPLIDFFNELDRETWIEEKLYDGVHPNTEGHEELYMIAKNQLKQKNLLPEDI
jgi:lysophospholipase L1-like esterase